MRLTFDHMHMLTHTYTYAYTYMHMNMNILLPPSLWHTHVSVEA